MTNLYGIKNCDTVRKAKRWLDTNNIAYSYHDFRDDGITPKLVKHWLKLADAEKLINKRSTSWKNLSDKDQQVLLALIDNKNTSSTFDNAVNILIETPTLIKRPVLAVAHDKITVGFSAENYTSLLG